MILAAFVQLGLFWRYRKQAIFPFCVALLVSSIWTLIYYYEYVGENIYLFGRMNVYPLTLWTVGLTLLFLVHEYILRRFNYVRAVISYLAVLAALEAFGYYVLGIRLNSNYTSLLGLGIIHAPPYMKIFYVVAGPVFIAITHNIKTASQKLRRAASI